MVSIVLQETTTLFTLLTYVGRAVGVVKTTAN